MDADFESSWPILSAAIKEIHRKDASRLSFEELYRTAYTIVIRKNGKRLYEAVKAEVRAHLESELNTRLLPKYKGTKLNKADDGKSASSTSSTTTLASTEPNIELLTVTLGVWNDHCICMRMISDILMYLDRVYSREADVPLIYDAGLSIFRDVVFNSVIEKEIYCAILGLLRKDREGITADRPIIKSVVSMLEYLPDTALMGKSIYIGRFEPILFEDTEKYYQDAADNLLVANHNASIYISRTNSWIKDENQRCNMYLLPSSLSRLQLGVQRVLITDRFPKVLAIPENGFKHWIDTDQYQDIKTTYELYQMVTSTFDVLKDILQAAVIERGMEINQRSIAALQAAKQARSGGHNSTEKGKGKSDSQSPTAIAIQWVEMVLTLKEKFDKIIKESLYQNSGINQAVDNSFAEFINKNNKVSEYLSLFIDDNLKKSLKGKTEMEIEDTLEKSIVLFRFIQDKDVFENYYKAHLAKRLLNSKSLSDDIERSMIAKLKMEIGTSFTSRLEGMFKDMKISQEMMIEYKEENEEDETVKRAKSETPGTPTPETKKGRVDISVNVLTSTFWPVSVVSSQVKCNYPDVIEQERLRFERFYLKRHTGRKLAWNSALGTADVKVRFAKRVHEINMPTLAMIILLQFTEMTDPVGLTFEQLYEATNISKPDLVRHLQSLAVAPRTRILRKVPMSKDVKPSDKFFFNNKFESSMTRFKVLAVSSSSKVETDSEKKETLAKVGQTRKYEVDAAIVRVMKTRKRMDHGMLVQDVISQLKQRFKADQALIKSRIDNLLEREYLERDPDERQIYNYLA